MSTNFDVDTQCHTVEGLVLQLAPIKIDDFCTLGTNSVVMPGANMQQGSILLEQSQVLKGETVVLDINLFFHKITT